MTITGSALGMMLSDTLHGSLLASVLGAQQQAQETIPQGDTRLLTIFVGLTMLALIFSALSLIVVAYVTWKLRSEVMGHVNDIKAKVMPIVEKSNVLVGDLTPHIKDITAKVNQIAGSVEKIAGVAKDKVEEFSPAVSAAKTTFLEANNTVRDVNKKTQAQVVRVNGMIAAALDATAMVSARIHHGINVPAREIAGIVTGLKAGIDTFLQGAQSYGRGPRPGTSEPVGQRPVAARPVAAGPVGAGPAAIRPVTPVPQPAADTPRMPLTADKRDLGL